jgi:hypothetical protein
MRRHDRPGPPEPVFGGHRFRGAYVREFGGDEFDMVSRDDGDDPDASYEGLENVRGMSHFCSSKSHC